MCEWTRKHRLQLYRETAASFVCHHHHHRQSRQDLLTIRTEATIADIQTAFKAKTLTCRMLVQMYLDRIEAYDKKVPGAQCHRRYQPRRAQGR